MNSSWQPWGWRFALFLSLGSFLSTGQAADMDPFLPNNTQAVVFLNVREALDSALYKKHLSDPVQAVLTNNGDLKQLLALFDLDPLKDVNSVTLAGPTNPNYPAEGIALVRGRFDLAKIQAASKEIAKNSKDFSIHVREGMEIYQVSTMDNLIYLVFLDKGCLAVASSKDYLFEIIAKNTGKKKTVLHRDMQAALSKTNGKQTAWLAALVSSEQKKELSKNDMTKNLADKLHYITGNAKLTDGIKLEMRAYASSPQGAAELRNIVGGLLSLLTLVVNSDPKAADYKPLLTETLQSLKLTTAQNALVGEIMLSAKLIDKAVKLVEKK